MFERDIEVHFLIGNFYFKTFYDSLIHLSLVLIFYICPERLQSSRLVLLACDFL